MRMCLIAAIAVLPVLASGANPSPWNGCVPVPEHVLRDAQRLRAIAVEDELRPLYHFAMTAGDATPGDPNGAFWANGRYHLFFLHRQARNDGDWSGRYSEELGFSWGHVSSADLVHWRHHPDAIVPENGDGGAFSGGAFVDADGVAWLSYWMLWGRRGIGLVRSEDADYRRWRRLSTGRSSRCLQTVVRRLPAGCFRRVRTRASFSPRKEGTQRLNS